MPKPKSAPLTVNLWWDRPTGRIHITSAEPGRVSFHTYLPPGDGESYSAATLALMAWLRAEGRDVQADPQSEDLHPKLVSS